MQVACPGMHSCWDSSKMGTQGRHYFHGPPCLRRYRWHRGVQIKIFARSGPRKTNRTVGPFSSGPHRPASRRLAVLERPRWLIRSHRQQELTYRVSVVPCSVEPTVAAGPVKKLPRDDFVCPNNQGRLGTDKGEGNGGVVTPKETAPQHGLG